MNKHEAEQLVDKWITIKNADSDDATIDIDGPIGEDWFGGGENTTKAIKEKLKQIANSKAKTITVNINSLGGSVNHGIAIHDALATHKAKIVTNVGGMTASAATIIAQAGDERRISDNALYLIHQPWSIFVSNVSELEQNLEDMRTINDRLIMIYTKRSGKKESEIRDLMEESNGNGKWLDADDALKFGLVDEKYEPMDAAAAIKNMPSAEAIEKFKIPQIPTAMKNVTDGDAATTTTENSDAMNPEEKKFLTGMIQNIKEMFVTKDETETKKPEETAETIQDEVQEETTEQTTETETQVEEETEVQADTGEGAQIIGETEVATEVEEAQEEETDQSDQDLLAEIQKLKDENAKYKGALAKADAGSTGADLDGPEGAEGSGMEKTPEAEQLNEDLKKLQGSWNGLHQE